MEEDLKETESYKLLKREIAVKHGYNLSDDDPVLMFVTLNEFMLNQYKEQIEHTLLELSDIVTNTKSDIANHIKEQEINLFKRIQEINNKNIENVHNQIKEYFTQEATAYKLLKKSYDVNFRFIKYGIFLNLIFILITIIIVIAR